jgi:hypothetical protein
MPFNILLVIQSSISGLRGRRGRDRMVVGFTIACAISVYLQ